MSIPAAAARRSRREELPGRRQVARAGRHHHRRRQRHGPRGGHRLRPRGRRRRHRLLRRAECRRFVDKAFRQFGRIDVLVNNAAYQKEQQSILDISEEQLNATFRTNIYGYFFMVQAALPHMKKGAVILNTGSVAASLAEKGSG